METFESVARSVVAEAGSKLRAAWRSSKKVEYKGPIDLVTEADREVEALVTQRLRQAFPDHLIIAEEASTGSGIATLEARQYVWFLDPLDGTTNFAHGYPHFAVSLALARGDELLFGIVHDPMRDETFAAHRGGGAWLNGEKIGVSILDRLNHALLGTGFAYDRRERTDFYLGYFKDFLRQAQGIRRGGSAALDLCYVACGRFDGFWEWKLQPWDVAAGVLIVREAGGLVTNFRGGPFDLRAEQTLASNGRIHDEMIRVLERRLEGG